MSAKLPRGRGGGKHILSYLSTMTFVMDKPKMVLLLLINCLCTPYCLCVWYSVFVFVLVCIICVPSRVPIILKRKIMFLLSHPCLAVLYVLWLFLTVPWVCLQCVMVVSTDHTRLLLDFTNI